MEEGVGGAVAGFAACPRNAETLDKVRERMIKAMNQEECFMFSLMIFGANQASSAWAQDFCGRAPAWEALAAPRRVDIGPGDLAAEAGVLLFSDAGNRELGFPGRIVVGDGNADQTI